MVSTKEHEFIPAFSDHWLVVTLNLGHRFPDSPKEGHWCRMPPTAGFKVETLV